MLSKEEVKSILEKHRCNYWIIFKFTHNDFYEYIMNNFNGTKFGEKLYKWLNDDDINIGKCLECGKYNCSFDDVVRGYRKYCSLKCSNKSKFVQKKKINSYLRNYGETNPSKVKSIKEKKKKTCLSHFNVECNLQCNDTKNKIKQTNLEKYGTEYPLQCNKLKKELLNANYKRFFDDSRYNDKIVPLFSIDEYNGVEFSYKWQCKLCNGIFESHLQDGRIPRCYDCFPLSISNNQSEIYEYIKFILPPAEIILINDRNVLNGLELDIYIPKLKLAIEFNGLYWHSELSGGKDKNYHINKLELCEKLNIQLINIFENEWIYNKDKIKKLLNDVIFKNKIDINDCIGVDRVNDFIILDRLYYNINSIFSLPLVFIDYLPIEKMFVSRYYSKFIMEESNDWVWNCGKLRYNLFQNL